ncbi:MAG: hypothetical protein QNL62_00805 [Gammaproteobacteria bacterium]|nr:hypothetical protein [Gammaproteobacteria bacterium]
MSMEKQEQREITVLVENLLLQFKDAIKSQEELNLQTARRISQIIRYGVATVIFLFIAAVFLAWFLKHDIGRMSGYMEEMARDVSTMSNAMVQMQTSMTTMERGVNNVAVHTQSISSAIVQTDKSVAVLSNIADSVKLMQNDVRGLNKSIESVNFNLTTINKQMKTLNGKLGAMGHDVNRMTSPTRMFPF